MGFWEGLGGFAKDVGKSFMDNAAQMQALKAEFEDKSSSELKDIVRRNRDSRETMVAAKILRGRGEM